MKRVHYGKSGCTVLYAWNGKPSFWGGRAADVKARAERLGVQPQASNIRLRIDGVEYAPGDVELVRR